VKILKNDKAKFEAALRKYLHTHSFYSMDEIFMCRDDLEYCFCKMFVVFYTVNLYVSCNMTCSKSYCLNDTLLDPWNACIYVYIPYIMMHFLCSLTLLITTEILSYFSISQSEA